MLYITKFMEPGYIYDGTYYYWLLINFVMIKLPFFICLWTASTVLEVTTCKKDPLTWARCHEYKLKGSALLFHPRNSPCLNPTQFISVFLNGGSTQIDNLQALALPGLRVGWLTCRNKDLLSKILMLKDYTTICPPAPSEVVNIRKRKSWPVWPPCGWYKTLVHALIWQDCS